MMTETPRYPLYNADETETLREVTEEEGDRLMTEGRAIRIEGLTEGLFYVDSTPDPPAPGRQAGRLYRGPADGG